ncbi:adenine phosphoribosyltransferase [Candidatus Koribacter versatilis Ellin345]|uniref:Adenine phosphoribosyltransferase n=1 Tax=Koribacter versatilis (strain Ellin345) TaxID=204669 RepID=APT_KORVE|nr:adenine phosphoribosyltransferase [Candidatus Koribacter versatilis]Q1IKJ1.1 RecName: Full=Adenine phosphoribosyltransferase; Short=APRT [Candidatus Koribacter versatilis Ellin345]ABF42609.1 adenine phosphoribosyltransferase [Candidatus Koribacter versatilis Ellin345]
MSESTTGPCHDSLKAYVREIPDYPKPGILFYDITTLIKEPVGLARTIDGITEHFLNKNIDLVVGMEARGFIFGPAVAYRLNAGFIPIRKPRKLPGETVKHTYKLEYGEDTLEIHKDAIQKAQRVLVVDDLLATGGTAVAATELVKQLGGEICGIAFVIELDFLNGRERLKDYDVYSLLHYDK